MIAFIKAYASFRGEGLLRGTVCRSSGLTGASQGSSEEEYRILMWRH